MLLDRPVVVFDAPELIARAKVNREKVAMLRGAADVAHDADGIRDAVERALANPAERTAQRRAISQLLFYEPGTAAQRAADCIHGLLALPVPAFARAELRPDVARPVLTDVHARLT